jgi:hypothetical protein
MLFKAVMDVIHGVAVEVLSDSRYSQIPVWLRTAIQFSRTKIGEGDEYVAGSADQ